MIDCENEVYTRVATALRAAHKGIDISGVTENVPSAFPHVSIEMTDNVMLRDTTDDKEIEEVVFTINIYSNVKSKKDQAKLIAKTADQEFRRMNAVRIGMNRTPNQDDPTIYRLTGLYRVRTDGTFFYRS